MKRKAFSYLALSFTLAAAFGISALYPAPDLKAEPYCSSTCAGATTKTLGPRTFTDDADCDWAEMDGFARLRFEATLDCSSVGFCSEPDIVITKACTATSPPFTVEMKATYSCARCGSAFQQSE